MNNTQFLSFSQFINEASQTTNGALFFDLDHTLIKPKSDKIFPKDKDDWEFILDVLNNLNFFKMLDINLSALAIKVVLLLDI
jgi:histidinol phosphatase-like enzyme